MTYKAYAGIGSRQTPEPICDLFTGFASYAEQLGWTLRSGAADGADAAFERGVKHDIHKEIYLPWGGFNGSKSNRTHPSTEAMIMARDILGAGHWNNLSEGAKKLHARNCHQVLGQHLKDPVQFVFCWTENGLVKGGTATAIKLAELHGIPVFNAGTEVDEAMLEMILNDQYPKFLRR